MAAGGQNFERRPQQPNMGGGNANMGSGNNSGNDMFSRRGQTAGGPNKSFGGGFNAGSNDNGNFGGQNFNQGGGGGMNR